ncbi:MAG: MBL fold metallo-hydrolase [Dehalococcoidia bacterium]|nr:MBL fold metallo-hydrolase [Dehalococcoidia bacterium]
MVIKWLGHACFLIVSRDGLRIITDPYTVDGDISYSPIEELADIVLVSHEHSDHNNVSAVQGKPEVVKGSDTRIVRGIQFKGVATYHDNSQGRKRGLNTVFCFTVDDIRLCHLGDIGHLLNKVQLDEIGAIDILFVPVGGFYTIGAAEASQVCEQLSPKVIIPMHFKTPKCAYPIAGVEDFLKGKEPVRKADSSEAEFALEKLPLASEILVLKPAL